MSLQGDHRPEAPARNPNVDWLADCLRSELSAVATFDIRFGTPVAISASSYQQVLLDINLAESLSGSVSAPPLTFDPQGAARLTSGAGATSPRGPWSRASWPRSSSSSSSSA